MKPIRPRTLTQHEPFDRHCASAGRAPGRTDFQIRSSTLQPPATSLLVPTLELKPTHKPVQKHYAALRQFSDPGVSREGACTAEKVRTLCASSDDLRARWADAAQRACSLA